MKKSWLLLLIPLFAKVVSADLIIPAIEKVYRLQITMLLVIILIETFVVYWVLNKPLKVKLSLPNSLLAVSLANIFSTIVGFVLYVLLIRQISSFSMSVSFLFAFLLTYLIETPIISSFIWKSKKRTLNAGKASLAANLITYLLLFLYALLFMTWGYHGYNNYLPNSDCIFSGQNKCLNISKDVVLETNINQDTGFLSLVITNQGYIAVDNFYVVALDNFSRTVTLLEGNSSIPVQGIVSKRVGDPSQIVKIRVIPIVYSTYEDTNCVVECSPIEITVNS